MDASYDPGAFPPFAVTVDLVVFSLSSGVLEVLLVERGEEPYQGQLALPGGFVRPDENLDQAAARELYEETAVRRSVPELRQLGAYGSVDRDPRMRVITVAYWAIARDLEEPAAGSDAAQVHLLHAHQAIAHGVGLAFDHRDILRDAVAELQSAVETTSLAVQLCRDEFSIADLRAVYEAIWLTSLDPANFTRKVLGLPGLMEPTGQRRTGGPGRPPELYRPGPARVLDVPFRRPTG